VGKLNELFSNSITGKALTLVPSYFAFRKEYKFLKKSQRWDRERLRKYQLGELKKIIKHSYKNVPYYRRLFKDEGIRPNDIKKLRDIRKIPFLTKEKVRENIEDLKARNFSEKKFEYVTTGGSTGTPLKMYYYRGKTRAIEWAYIKDMWDRVDYSFLDKCAYLKGAKISKENKNWEKTFFGRWLKLSTFHMTEENLSKYVKRIRRFKPKYVQSFPSTITVLAEFMKKKNIDPFPSLRAIFCSSENLYPKQRELLSDVFDCRVFSWYGHAERAVLAGECEMSNDYHIYPQYGITEIVDEKGNVINDKGKRGLIVGTSLTNYIMPLIRYKTDDVSAYKEGECSCGISYELLESVTGRWKHEYLIGKEGQTIPLASVNVHSDIYDNVERLQFYQDERGEVILKIVKKDNYSQKDTQRIKNQLNAKWKDSIDLQIQFVDEISRTDRGKYMFVDQKLDIELNELI